MDYIVLYTRIHRWMTLFSAFSNEICDGTCTLIFASRRYLEIYSVYIHRVEKDRI